MERQSLIGELEVTRNENKVAPKLDASKLPQLPNGWYWTTIGQIGHVKGGKRLPQGHSYSPTRTDFPYLRVVDFDNFGIRQTDLKYLTRETQSILRRYTISKYDVYISIAGTIGAVGVVPDNLDGANLTENAAKIVLQSTNINRKYLCYWLASLNGQSFIASRTLATTQPKLALYRIEQIPFPLAPRPTQDQVVAEIEKQFTRLEAGVAGLRRVRANLKRYRAAVLKAACEGKLVATEAELARREGRTYETGAQLLDRILTEHREQWNGRGKYKEPIKPDTTNLPPLPEGWSLAAVDQLASIGSGNTPAKITDCLSAAGDIAWFKVGDMNNPENSRSMRIAENYLSKASAERLGLRLFPAGTIVFPKRGGAIATNKKRILETDATTDLNVMGLTTSTKVSQYFWWWFSSLDLANFSDGSNVPQINNKDILPIPVPLPPLAEQQRIVAEVERRLSLAEEMEAVVKANLQRATRLRQSILQRAFAGELW